MAKKNLQLTSNIELLCRYNDLLSRYNDLIRTKFIIPLPLLWLRITCITHFKIFKQLDFFRNFS